MARTLPEFGVRDAAEALNRGEVSSLALIDACLERIAARNESINAFVHVAAAQSRDEAARSDARRRDGSVLSALDGVPIAIKDNIDVDGQPTTNGSGMSWMPATAAGVATALRARGLVPIGKTNMHEGALGATTDNPHHGRTDNPVVPGSTPGGSSGGSAAAVASGMCPVAIGTDTMGSVRLPAAYCGIVGFKPSRIFWPLTGVIPLAAGLDTTGPLARSVGDIAMLMDVPLASRDLDSLVFATIENFDDDQIDVGMRSIFDDVQRLLQEAGVALRRVKLPGYNPTTARRAGLLVSEVEAWVEFEDWISRHPEAFSAEFKRLLDYGADVSASRYVKARREITRIGTAFAGLFDSVDAIVSLTTPQTAFPSAAPVPATQADFTAPANFADCPAISIPAHRRASSCPVGLQLMAAPGRDAILLGLAAAVEAILGQQ